MAIEENLNLLRELFSNRNGGNSGIYNTHMGSGVLFAGLMPETLLPFPHLPVSVSVPMKTSMKSDSGVTYNVPSATRKRYRDSGNNQIISSTSFNMSQVSNSSNLSDTQLQMHQHQLEIDHIVLQHTKRLRLELEEKQKRQTRLLVSAIGEGVAKKLKEKDEQFQRMGKLNWVLQERVKSLYAENQLWRDLAQSNEATANSLRTNLEQVLLANVSNERLFPDNGAAADDAESYCDNGDDYGSVGAAQKEEDVDRQMLAVEGGDWAGMKDKEVVGGGENWMRMCKRCAERESSVLLMPCRHICLCHQCVSSLIHTCPVCNCSMNATLHMNMS